MVKDLVICEYMFMKIKIEKIRPICSLILKAFHLRG